MLEKKCEKCGITITADYPSHLKRKKYCWDCGLKVSAEKRMVRVKKICLVCGKEFWIKKSHSVFRECCSRKCKDTRHRQKISGQKHPRWKEIKEPIKIYEKICFPGGKYKYKHRYLMEQKIGRKLERNEIVHHINGNTRDNRIENLQLMTLSEHTKLHYQH